jgi:hypothetical protein
LRFLAIDLAKNISQNPSIYLFLEPPATISAKSKPPKTVSLSGDSLVKKIGKSTLVIFEMERARVMGNLDYQSRFR